MYMACNILTQLCTDTIQLKNTWEELQSTHLSPGCINNGTIIMYLLSQLRIIDLNTAPVPITLTGPSASDS